MKVATVLTVYGIETFIYRQKYKYTPDVATVLTVYGIETVFHVVSTIPCILVSQQYLPFTVLKLFKRVCSRIGIVLVATVLTVYGIETDRLALQPSRRSVSRNSTYRLRY